MEELLLLHPKRGLHLADKVRSFEKFHAALPAVFNVSKGIDIPIFVHALHQVGWSALWTPKRMRVQGCCLGSRNHGIDLCRFFHPVAAWIVDRSQWKRT